MNERGLRFDDSVPVEIIEPPVPEVNGPDADEYEQIDTKITRRLAQRPSSYVVLEYRRAVISIARVSALRPFRRQRLFLRVRWPTLACWLGSTFGKALAYGAERESSLRLFLCDSDVPIDTNHLERALYVIPIGRRNGLFNWTEASAQQVGVIQSLLVTCRLHSINPYTYLVDVLQRVSLHPARGVEDLTSLRWKVIFVDNPMKSDLAGLGKWRLGLNAYIMPQSRACRVNWLVNS